MKYLDVTEARLSMQIVSLLKATGNRPRVHGNGFIQLDLSPSMRLHVWGDGRIPRQSVDTPKHDHTFGFTSYVLSGAIRNVVFTLRPSADGAYIAHSATVRHDQDTELSPTGLVCDLVVESDCVVRAGESYEMVPGQIHESIPVGQSMSVIVKNGRSLTQGGPSPLVFVPRNVRPDNVFDRYATPPDVLWAVIADSIDRAVNAITTAE